MSNKGRTIIRDPRKTKKSRDAQKQRAIVATKANEIEEHSPIVPQSHNSQVDRPRMAFEPSTTNQQSLGLGSYMLAGVGVAVGATIVSAIFGAVGL